MFIKLGKKKDEMSKEELGELSEPVLKLLYQVDQLITQGKLEEAMEIIEGRETEEGIEELRWRIVESKWRNKKGENNQVIEITEVIKKDLAELEKPVEHKGDKERKRIRIDALNEEVWALSMLGRHEEGLEKIEEGIRLLDELDELDELLEKEVEYKDNERKARFLNCKGVIYWQKGELNKSLELFKGCLAKREEAGDSSFCR